jgi:hypothetical protein
MLQVPALKASSNWFMRGHSTPGAIKMLPYGSYSTFSLVHKHQELSSSDSPCLSIITANGWTWSLGKPKQSAKRTSLLGMSGYRTLSKYVCSLHVTLTSEPSAPEHTVTVVAVHYFARNDIAEENQLVGNVGEIWCNWRSSIWEPGVTEIVTLTKHREMAGEWKNDLL